MFFLILFGTGTKAASAGSNYSGDVQYLFWITAAGSVFVGAIVFFLLFYFIYKYRETQDVPRNRVTDEAKFEKAWIAFAILLVIILVGVSTPILLQIQNPTGTENAVEMKVSASRFQWNVTVDGQSQIFSPKSNHNHTLNLQINTMYMLNLTSNKNDVIHSFFVYDLDFKIDAVPGQFNIKYFKILNPGDYIVTCAEFCGSNHYDMQFTIHAE